RGRQSHVDHGHYHAVGTLGGTGRGQRAALSRRLVADLRVSGAVCALSVMAIRLTAARDPGSRQAGCLAATGIGQLRACAAPSRGGGLSVRRFHALCRAGCVHYCVSVSLPGALWPGPRALSVGVRAERGAHGSLHPAQYTAAGLAYAPAKFALAPEYSTGGG